MRTILCPTDFSETALHTIAYAGKFAKATGSDLTLLHVQSLFSLTASEAVWGKEMKIQGMNDRLEEQCREVSRVFKISCYAEVDTTIRSLSTVIAEKAAGFDLIIIGTSGTQDYYHSFFGSNAYRVVKESSVPVLLLPSGAGYQDVSTMVFAFDYWREHGLPVMQLVKWAKMLGSDIRVLQIVQTDLSRKLEASLKNLQRDIQESHSDLSIQFDTVYSDEVGESIHDYMISHEADILALCSVHHGFAEKIFHKSVIKKVAEMARYPMFVFHKN
jgi:nucleotide-binding universal stress UspA family protein